MADKPVSIIGTAFMAHDNEDGTVVLHVDSAGGIGNKRRDACEVYPNDDIWEATVATGDFIIQRGNTAGAGWIEISKSPWQVDTETVIGFKETFDMPNRIFGMVSLTHRAAGQQVTSINLESEDVLAGLTPLADPVPVEILNASQTTTVITINFATAPAVPYRVGQVVSVYGFLDNRLNVSNATVATVPTDLQITLVGNDYAFTSTTITTTLGNGAAFIERREMLGNSRNAVGIVHSNATATNLRAYARSQGGVARPSGTLAAAHNFTAATDAGTAAVVAPKADAWLPGSEFLLMTSREHITYADRAVDVNATWTNRWRQTQVVPNPDRQYKLKVRTRNTPSANKVLAAIVSITKAGSATATIQLDRDHGLAVGNYVGFHGVRDQTAFANATAGLIITAVPTTSSLQVVHGSSATATSYGGFLWVAQGQQALGGAVAQVAQSISRTGNVVTLTGNTNWGAPATTSNIVELIGCRDATTGADLGFDGVYNVINIATTALTLEPVPTLAPTGGDVVLTNCGGGVVQRFGVRLHVLMALDYNPQLVEFAFKGNSDAGEATPIQGTVNAAISGTWSVGLSAGTNEVGRVMPAAVTTPFFLNSAASNNATLVLTGPGSLTGFHATNTGAAAAYVKLYNKATAPTVGTDVPVMIITIPAAVGGVPGTNVPLELGANGIRFALGLGLAIVTGAADTDNTAVAAGQVKVGLSRIL